MALKYSLPADAHAALSAEQQALYKARENGEGFALDVEIAHGDDGIEDVSGLKSSLAKERDNFKTANRELAKIREQLGDLTPEQIVALRAKATQFNDLDPAQLAAQKAELDAQAAKLQDTISKAVSVELDKAQAPLRKQIAEQQRYNETTQAIDDNKGNRALLLSVIKDQCKFGDDGKVTLAGVEHASIGDALKAMRGMREYESCFAGSGNSGGGARPHGVHGGGGNEPAPGGKRSRMSIAEKAAYVRDHGTDQFMQLPY